MRGLDNRRIHCTVWRGELVGGGSEKKGSRRRIIKKGKIRKKIEWISIKFSEILLSRKDLVIYCCHGKI